MGEEEKVEKQAEAVDESAPEKFTCSACQVREARVWRLTREEPRVMICNNCYCQKYQPVCAGLPPDSSDEDTIQANGTVETNGNAEDTDTAKRKIGSEAEPEAQAAAIKEEPVDDEPMKKKVKKEKKKDK